MSVKGKRGGGILSLLLFDVSLNVRISHPLCHKKDSIGLNFKKNLGDSLLCIVQREINFPIHSIKHEKGKWYPMPG